MFHADDVMHEETEVTTRREHTDVDSQSICC